MARDLNLNSLELGTDLTVTSTDITSAFIADLDGVVNANDVMFTSVSVDGNMSSLEAIGFSYVATTTDFGSFSIFTDGASAFSGLQSGGSVDVVVDFTVDNNGTEETGELRFTVVAGENDYDATVLFSSDAPAESVFTVDAAGAADEAELSVLVLGELSIGAFFDSVDLTDDAPSQALEEVIEDGAGIAAAFASGADAIATARISQLGVAIASAEGDANAEATGAGGIARATAEFGGSEAIAAARDGASATARAENDSTADVSARGEFGLAEAVAVDGSDVHAFSINGSAAADASNQSSAYAVTEGGDALATAFLGSDAFAASEGGSAVASAGLKLQTPQASAEDVELAAFVVVEDDIDELEDLLDRSSAIALSADEADAEAEATVGSTSLSVAVDASRSVAQSSFDSVSAAFAENASLSVAESGGVSGALAVGDNGGVSAANAQIGSVAETFGIGAAATAEAEQGSAAQAQSDSEAIGVFARDGDIVSAQYIAEDTASMPLTLEQMQLIAEGGAINGASVFDVFSSAVSARIINPQSSTVPDLAIGLGETFLLTSGEATELAPNISSIDSLIEARELFNVFLGEQALVEVSSDEDDFVNAEAPISYGLFAATRTGALEPGLLSINVSEIGPQTANSVSLSGFPAGTMLSDGDTQDNGVTWSFIGALPEDLSFTPPQGFSGEFDVIITVASDEGETTIVKRALVDAPAGNVAPDIAPIEDQDILEDETVSATAAEVQLLLDGLISDADDDAVSVTVILDYPAGSGISQEVLIINPMEAFSYTPPPLFFGEVSVTIRADDGQGADNSVTEETFTLNVLPVNNAPFFNFRDGTGIELTEREAGIDGFVQFFTVGPANENDQSISYEVTTDNDALFDVLPTITPDGRLEYAVAPNAGGEATVTVVAKDDGGTANGGSDASAPQTFTISVDEIVGETPPVAVFDAPGVEMFDGTGGSVIEIPHEEAFEFDNGAVAFSFIADDLSGVQGLFTKDARFFEGGGNHVLIVLDGDELSVRLQDGRDSEFLSFPGIEAGREYEIALNFGPDGAELWVDGVMVDTAEIAVDWRFNQEFIQWGARGWASPTGRPGFDAPFNGKIVDRQIYDGTLGEEDVLNLASSSSTEVENQDPIADDDLARTVEDTPVEVRVLENDSDPDNDRLRVTEIGEPRHGEATLNDDGVTITYTPNNGFIGEDLFTYEITDGQGGVAQAFVRIGVREDEGGIGVPVFNGPGVAAFDGARGSVIEIPHEEAFEIQEGTIAFSFVANDLNGAQGLFTKDARFFEGGGNHILVVLEGSTLSVRLQDGTRSEFMTFEGVEAGREYEFALTFGPDGAELWVDGVRVDTADIVVDLRDNQEFIQWGARGWASPTGQPGFDAPFNGLISDRMIFGEVLDEEAIADLASASSIDNDENSPPEAVDDMASTTAGQSVSIDVLDNDSDPDDDVFDVLSNTQPQNGGVVYDDVLGFIYTPNDGFVGGDSFDYTIIDQNGATDTATVRIAVEGDVNLPQPVFGENARARFDGSREDVINIEHQEVFEVDEGTIAFSFISGDPAQRQGLVVKDASFFAGGGNHFAAYIEDGELIVRFQDAAQSEQFTFDIERGVHYEVAAVFSSEGVKAYVNGDLIGESDLVISLANNEQFLQIGGLGWASTDGGDQFVDPFLGLIGDVELYDQALNDEQIDLLALQSSLLVI